MKLKSPTSLQAWLFAAGAVLLLLAGLVHATASILAPHLGGGPPSGGEFGIHGASLALEFSLSILELAGLGCIILAALVSIFRTILPPKMR